MEEAVPAVKEAVAHQATTEAATVIRATEALTTVPLAVLVRARRQGMRKIPIFVQRGTIYATGIIKKPVPRLTTWERLREMQGGIITVPSPIRVWGTMWQPWSTPEKHLQWSRIT